MIDPLAWQAPSERAAGWLATARELAERFAARAPAHDQAASFAFENIADLQAAGFHRLPLPAEYDGWAVTLPEAVRILETLASGDGPTALIFAMHVQVLGSASEGRPWDEPRFAQLCRAVAADGGLVNATATEPELGSPSHGGLPATAATWVGDGWRITGRKSWATGAPILGHFLTPAVLLAPDVPPGTVGIFDLRPGRPGLRIEETWDVMGMRTTGSHDLVLEDVAVAADDLLVRRLPGTADAGRVSNGAWFGMAVSAVYLGIAMAAREVAVRFAHERRPSGLGGKSIASLEVIQGRLGRLEAELLTARSWTYSLADAWQRFPERRPELTAHVGLSKVVATNHAVTATGWAMRLVGGTAMERKFPLERLFRDVEAGLFHPPADEQGYARLGQALLGESL